MQQYSKQDIHPSVFEAVDEFNSQVMSGESGGQPKAYNAYTSAWFEAHWRGFMIWAAGIIPTIATIPFLRNSLDVSKPASVGVFGVALVGWIAAGIYGYERTKRDVTAKELEAILPALTLSESQKLYLTSVVSVLTSKILDDGQKRSWLQALYQALDNALSLEKIHSDMRASIGGLSHQEMLAEIAGLETKVESANDMMAKSTYQESLELAKGRLARSNGMAAQSERIEAQLELTRQTFLQTQESLSGLSIGSQQSAHVSLDPLRANLSRVQNESQSILKAIEELNQA